MDFKDWELLSVLSKELNITKTAKKLYTSQPAITYRLGKLEEEFGVIILKRLSTGVMLTEEGKYLIEYSNKMLNEYYEVRENILKVNKNDIEKIRIGISTTVAKYKLGSIIGAIKNEFPNMKLEIKTGTSSSEVLSFLKKLEVDMAIIRGEVEWNEKIIQLSKEPYGILTYDSFEKDNLYLMPYVEVESKNNVSSKEFFLRWAQENKIDLSRIERIKVNSIEASIELVKENFGFTVIPKLHTKNLEQLYFYPLGKKDDETYFRKTYLLAKTDMNEEKDKILNFLSTEKKIFECKEI